MSIVDKLIGTARSLAAEGSTHDFAHVERVLKIASYMALKENADLEIVQVSALLHDIGRSIGEPHSETGAEKAREILMGLGYPEEKTRRVEQAIHVHSFSDRDKVKTLEEGIVWDADKIDGLGAIGLASAFHLGGERRESMTQLSWFQGDTRLRYERLFTETARRLAKPRWEFMEQFMQKLEEEISLTDLLDWP